MTRITLEVTHTVETETFIIFLIYFFNASFLFRFIFFLFYFLFGREIVVSIHCTKTASTSQGVLDGVKR